METLNPLIKTGGIAYNKKKEEEEPDYIFRTIKWLINHQKITIFEKHTNSYRSRFMEVKLCLEILFLLDMESNV